LISKLNFFTEYSKDHPLVNCCETHEWLCRTDVSAGIDAGCTPGGSGDDDTAADPCDLAPFPLRCDCTRSDGSGGIGYCTAKCTGGSWRCAAMESCTRCN
jgi:hypothetical protein